MSEKTGETVLKLAAKHWVEHYNNCSGLVKAVASDLGITLNGTANMIMDNIKTNPWIKIEDGAQAKAKVEKEGYFVIAGKKEKGNGHVVVIVPGPMSANGLYPTGYWGNLGAKLDPKQPVNTSKKQYATINWSWTRADLKHVTYHGIKIPSAARNIKLESMRVMPDASGGLRV